MLAFFENSWALWWLVAILATLRWFHLMAGRAGRINAASSGDFEGSAAALKQPHPSSL